MNILAIQARKQQNMDHFSFVIIKQLYKKEGGNHALKGNFIKSHSIVALKGGTMQNRGYRFIGAAMWFGKMCTLNGEAQGEAIL